MWLSISLRQLTTISWRLLEAMTTGSFNFVAGFGSVEAEITAELTSKLRPLSLYALTKKTPIK